MTADLASLDSHVRAIAFYLPQFHPVPENDEWWGRGFTEWSNVVRARPRFKGHYQPHLPADLGFYDLRVPEVRAAQAALARQHGIHGFCYYHYWFGGRRILERPFNEVLSSGEPDFPFCLCWANENWSRAWDGSSRHLLLEQKHSIEDDRAHIQHLIPAFRDERYIRINGKPLFLLYRTELLPNPSRTAEIWREEAIRAGIGEIYLARVEQFVNNINPADIGFDAAIEFAPSGDYLGALQFRGFLPSLLSKLGALPTGYADNNVTSYSNTAQIFMNRPEPDFKRFHCITPMWDNSARRKTGARILTGSTPALYENWLHHTLARTRRIFQNEERIVFINAWNEWAEGCHLEPDTRWGRAYLDATLRALNVSGNTCISSQSRASTPAPSATSATPESVLQGLYWKNRAKLRELKDLVKQLSCPGKYTDD